MLDSSVPTGGAGVGVTPEAVEAVAGPEDEVETGGFVLGLLSKTKLILSSLGTEVSLTNPVPG